jgi:hypothetical protein
VQDAIDWISLDFYRLDSTAWTTPEQQYAAQVYPKFSRAGQRALLVPQAFGRSNDVCAPICYTNTSVKGCCPMNHKYLPGSGGSGECDDSSSSCDLLDCFLTSFGTFLTSQPVYAGRLN